MDHEHKEQLFRLLRFEGNFSEDLVSVEDYIKKMQPG